MKPYLLLLCILVAGCQTVAQRPAASTSSIGRLRDAGVIVRTKVVEIDTSAKKIATLHQQQQEALSEMEQLVVGLQSRIADELKPDLDRLRAKLNEAEVRERMQGEQIAALTTASNEALAGLTAAETAAASLKKEIATLEQDRNDQFARANKAESAISRWKTFGHTVLAGIFGLAFYFAYAALGKLPVLMLGPYAMIGRLAASFAAGAFAAWGVFYIITTLL